MIVQNINSSENIVKILKKSSFMKKEGALFYGRCYSCGMYSMVASEASNICHCFSCNFGGTPAEVLISSERLLFKEISMYTKVDQNIIDGARAMGKRVLRLNEIAAEHYHHMLFSPVGKDYLEYLHKRGLTDDVIRMYKLGFATNSYEFIAKAQREGYTKEEIISFGIFSEAGHDKFYKRIMFPLIDYRGFIVGFTGRSLDSDPKYLNSSRSPIYDKSTFLYGLDKAKPFIGPTNAIVLVEGQMDTIAMQTNDVQHTVGVSGTAFTEEHVIILERLMPNIGRRVVLGFDSDEAGIKATKRAIDMLSSKFEISVMRSKLGKDASEHFQIVGKVSDFELISDTDFLLSLNK